MASLPSPPRTQSVNAVPGGTTKKDSCTRCGQPVAQYYFRVNGAMHCMPCAKVMKGAGPDDAASSYKRAVLFGGITALVALTICYVLGITIGWLPGYLAFIAGYAIAKMMMVGSKKVGGRKYQLTAIVLTYMAVSLSAVPIMLAEQARWKAAVLAQQHSVDLAQEQRELEEEFGTGTDRQGPPNGRQQAAKKKPNGDSATSRTTPVGPGGRPLAGVSPAATLASLMALGLFSPFLALLMPLQGGVALLILLGGMLIAWQVTAATRHEIIGPFRI